MGLLAPPALASVHLVRDITIIRSSDLEAEIWSEGATLARLTYRNGRQLVLSFADADDPTRQTVYAGCVVGPVANRVRAARAHVGRATYQMVANENARTSLHSGPDGLHGLNWQVAERDAMQVTLRTTLPDGHCGLPGTRSMQATYTIGDGCLRLIIEATTTRPTPMAPAHHPYWRLDDSATVLNHSLTVRAPSYLPLADDRVPTGAISPVFGTEFDYRKPRAVRRRIDHTYCLGTSRRDLPAHAARLVGSSGVTLDVFTTEPGLQVYTGDGLPRADAALVGGGVLGPNAGIALEPQGWPNATNTPAFPPVLLEPGQKYRQITEYRIKSEPTVT